MYNKEIKTTSDHENTAQPARLVPTSKTTPTPPLQHIFTSEGYKKNAKNKNVYLLCVKSTVQYNYQI